MRYLIWLLRILLFLLLLAFAVRNVETVTLRYYFGYEWQAPLILIVLVFFALGVVTGVASCLTTMLREKPGIPYRGRDHQPSEHE